MDPISRTAAILRADFAREAADGFLTLRRIPATGIIKLLDYFADLSTFDRDQLLDAFARLGAMRFHNSLNRSLDDPAYLAWRAAMQSERFGYGLRYVDVKMARMMLSDPESLTHMAELRSKIDWEPRDDPPAELAPQRELRQVQPAKAPLLRKLVDSTFAALLAAKKAKAPGGETEYAGTLAGTELKVSFDFGSRLGQVRYAARLPMPDGRVVRLAFEDLWGGGPWDYLTEENAARCIDLLARNLEYLVDLRNRVAAPE